MAFEEKIEILLDSVFNSKGFDQLNRRMATLMEQHEGLNKILRQGKGMSNMQGEMEDLRGKFNEAGVEIRNFQDQLADADKQTSSQFGPISRQFAEGSERKAALRQLKEFGTVFEDLDGGGVLEMGQVVERVKENFDSMNMSVGELRDKLGNMPEGSLQSTFDDLESIGGKENLDFGVAESVGQTKEEFLSLGEQFPDFLDDALSEKQRLRLNIADAEVDDPMAQFKGDNANTDGMTGINEKLRMQAGGKGKPLSFQQGLRQIGIFETLSAATEEFGGRIREAAPSVRNLQMRLLGLQFTMLTVAFIFGGLLASALGAVGAFEILGNTLKFLFLPTALSLLDPLLSIQDRVFNLDEETRKFIGDVFALISVVSIAIGIFAALAQPIVGLVGGLVRLRQAAGTLGVLSGLRGIFSILGTAFGSKSMLGGLIKLFGTSPGGLFAALKSSLPAITTAGSLSTLGSIIGTIKTIGLAFTRLSGIITVVVAAVLGFLQAFSRFEFLQDFVNGTIDLIVGGFNFLIDVIMNVLRVFGEFFNGLKNLFSGGFTIIFGIINALLGNGTDMIRKGFEEVLFGIGKIFESVFGDIFRFLSNDVIGGIVDFGRNLVFALIDTIVDKASALKDAILAVLPDFATSQLDLNIEAIGKKAKDFIDQGIQGVSEFTGQFEGFQLGSDVQNSATGNDAADTQSSPGQTVNNVSVQADLRKGQDTPREKGRKLGEGVASGLVNKGSNFSTGT